MLSVYPAESLEAMRTTLSLRTAPPFQWNMYCVQTPKDLSLQLHVWSYLSFVCPESFVKSGTCLLGRPYGWITMAANTRVLLVIATEVDAHQNHNISQMWTLGAAVFAECIEGKQQCTDGRIDIFSLHP